MYPPSKPRNFVTRSDHPQAVALERDGTLCAGAQPGLMRLSRRAFLMASGSVLASFGAWDRIAEARPQPGEDPSPEDTELVETSICRLRLDRRHGNLVGLTWNDPSLEIIQERRLGENFRILLPRPGYEANYFTSSGQKVSRIEKTETGVTSTYDMLRNARETLNVKVRYQITAVDKRLEFTIEVENPTEFPLAEVFWGIVGGQQGLGNRQDTESLVPGWDLNAAPGVFTKFRPNGVNLGIRYEMAEFSLPEAGDVQVGTHGASVTSWGLASGQRVVPCVVRSALPFPAAAHLAAYGNGLAISYSFQS